MFKSFFYLSFVAVLLHQYLLGDNVVWETKVLKYNVQPETEVVEGIFRFKVGDNPFKINTIRSSCGCTTAKLAKKLYEPGESGEIQVKFDLGSRIGEQKKFVMLQTDDPDHSDIQLELNVFIPQILKIEPRFVYWTKGSSDFGCQKIKLTCDTEIPARVLSVSSDTKQLEVSFQKVSDKIYEIDLKPSIPDGEKPFFRSVIKIEVEADFTLKQKFFYAYAFMKS